MTVERRLSLPSLPAPTGWLWPALAVAGMFAAWEGAVSVFAVPAWKLPAPLAIAAELVESRSLFLRHTWTTLQEVLVGFGVALFAGVTLAGLIAYSRTLERAVYPFVIASQTIPIIVIAPLLLIWVGYGLTPKVIVVALIAFFPIVVNTVDGLRSVDPDMVNMMRSMGASRWQLFSKVQAPTSLPYLFSGVKVAVTPERHRRGGRRVGGGERGAGVPDPQSLVPLFLTERSFGAVAVLSLLGVGLFLAVAALERVMLPWHYTAARARSLSRE